MKQLTCEMCGSTDLVKQDGVFICQTCGCRYSVEEAKRMMIEGTVEVQGTVKVDNSAFVEKYLANARRAYGKQDWEEVEKYYNMVEQNSPDNMEAVFFSAFGKAMLSLSDSDYFKREQKFKVLEKSISVINDYYEETAEDKETALVRICDAIADMFSTTYVYNSNALGWTLGGSSWQEELFYGIVNKFIAELRQIAEKHDDTYIQILIYKLNRIQNERNKSNGGCYIATAVYGSYDCPQVWTLRRFRDNTLAKTWYGRTFIRTYYAVSPTLVKWFGETKWFKKMWQGKLDRLVTKLQSEGVASTPYTDREW